tara:strand:+ start:6056 stop:6235 length:180 start_codon:yes stop_codon:yes gene_type:complete
VTFEGLRLNVYKVKKENIPLMVLKKLLLPLIGPVPRFPRENKVAEPARSVQAGVAEATE